MEYTIPDYYQRFSCIAAACEDTCCAGWGIVIDEKTMKKYKSYGGGFGNRLSNDIDFEVSSFRQYDHRCAFLNDRDLCDIYEEAGKEMLCKTCKRYPRHVEEYEGLRELSLSLSCPEAARIILSNKEKVRFLTKERNHFQEEYEDFDYLLFTKLMDARNVIFDIVQNREQSLRERLMFSLTFGHDLQRRICHQQLFEMDEMFEHYKDQKTWEKQKYIFEKYFCNIQKRYLVMKKVFSCLYQLEVLKPQWHLFVKKCEQILYGHGFSHYQKVVQNPIDECAMEQLMVYFVYVHFSGSIYDEDPYSKLKLAVVGVLLIRELLLAQSYEKGGVDMADIVGAAQRFAKEVEHSDVNLNRLEEIFKKDDVFLLKSLLSAC